MSAYIVWILTMRVIAQASGLECNWDWNTGRIIADATGYGTIIDGVPSQAKCQGLCLTRADFLCHSVMYRSDDSRCVLFAENNQTAHISTSKSGDMAFQYAYRPQCAGVWFPWLAERGKKLSGSRDFTTEIRYSNTRVQSCMTECLQTNSDGSNPDCRSIVVGVVGANTAGVCERWDAREGDPGRSLEVNNADLLTINRPLLYMDGASSATNAPVTDIGAARWAPQLFTDTHRLPVSGYLIAWQYYVNAARVGPRGCDSFADIWRERNDSSTTPIRTWTLISKTQLTGYNTSGVKFQYVSDSVIRVQKDDFVGIHVSIQINDRSTEGLPEGCDGNIVSFTGSSGPHQYLLEFRDPSRERIRSLTNGSTFSSNDGISYRTKREGSIRAFISPYVGVDSAPTVRHEERSLIMNWTSISQDVSLAGYRITCSHSSDFSTLVSCHQETLVTGAQTTLTPANSGEPTYARVQVVRNILGVEEADMVYSEASNRFCAVLDTAGLQIGISEGQLTPDTGVRVTVSVNGLQPVACLEQISITYSPASANQQPVTLDETNPTTTMDLGQGAHYNFRLQIELQDNHEYDSGVNKNHTVSTAPPAPENLSVDEDTRTQTSVVLIWSAVSYTTRTLKGYRVTCEVTNSTFNNPSNTSHDYEVQPDTVFNAIGLSPAVQYECGVNARLENGHGVKAFFLRFWTQPQELNATWNVTNAASAPGVGMIKISLPAVPSGSIYRYLQVRVDHLATRRKENTNSIVAELDLNAYNLLFFMVGDNEIYGGYHNDPVATGSYKISVGFRAVTEDRVLRFYAVPGADAIQIVGPTTTTTNYQEAIPRSRLLPLAALAAVPVLVGIVVVSIFLRRRLARASQPSANRNGDGPPRIYENTSVGKPGLETLQYENLAGDRPVDEQPQDQSADGTGTYASLSDERNERGHDYSSLTMTDPTAVYYNI